MLDLNNHEQVAKMFDIVIWLKVSKEGSKENLSRKCLQQDIVQRLQLKMGDKSNVDEVAQRILTELKDKNYLLLLDDVKDDINLSEIGIPYSHNRSKIVLTTRLHHVCSSMVKKEIKEAEDLLGNDHGKTKTSVMIAHCILNRLMNVSLLEEGKSENHITMHKFMRQVELLV
ncbi:hypothetical protein ACSBR1_019053 [Camellia fascicularis]